MSNLLKLVLFIIGSIYTITVVTLLVKKRINEKNTIVWLTGSIMILILSSFPEVLNTVAGKLGVSYPPSLLFLLSVLILLIIVLYQSIQISTLNEKLKEISQYIAIHDNKEYEEKNSTSKKAI